MSLPMDDVAVEIAPGADLSADPSTWTWSDLCAHTAEYPAGRVQRPVTIRQGRRSEGSTAPPSECTFEVRNEDGALTPTNPMGPWFGDLGRGTPLRVSWGGSERFFGFISELPTTWLGVVDNSRVRIAAEGPTRRMAQGAEALSSPLHRSLSTHPNVVAYWPCEDGRDATSGASPIMGVRPLSVQGVQFGESPRQSTIQNFTTEAETNLPGASSVMAVPFEGSSVTGRVPNHTPGGVYVVELAWLTPDEPATSATVMEVHTTSPDFARCRLLLSSSFFTLQVYDGDGTEVINLTQSRNVDVYGRWVRAELRLDEDTGLGQVNVRAYLFDVDVDQTELNSVISLSNSGEMGRVTRVSGMRPGFEQVIHVGHIAVLTGTEAELPAYTSAAPTPERHAPFHGWDEELAADRFERLCSEEGLSCEVLALTGGLELPGVAGSTASAPDAAALDVTGDLEVRAWLRVGEWATGSSREIVSKWESTGDQRSWGVYIRTTGGLGLSWTTDGTLGTFNTSSSPAVLPTPPSDGLIAVAFTLDVDDGAGGHVVNLYTHPDIDADLSDWTQIHTETNAGTTSVFSGSADLVVGNEVTGAVLAGLVRKVRVYDGIGGTLVADPDFDEQTVGATSFTDGAGNTWTVNGDAAIVRADDSMPMGPQRIDTLLANFRDIEATDGGILNELTYRTRTYMYNQAATAIEFCDLNGAPELVNDDRSTRNDVTASRPDGSSVRLVDQAHIDRFGRYDDSREVNVADGDLLRQVAAWWLSQGTSEVPRWPLIPLSINSETQDLLADWLALRIGDRISIPHEVPQMLGVDVDLIVVGWTETIYSRRAEMVLTCTPAFPYAVAVFDAARFDAAASSTSGSFVAGTDTSLTVVTAAGSRPWINSTDHAAEFPLHIRVSGVVLNVTAISGAASPQTFTVDASPVNGVAKTIPDGSAVRLADTPVFAL